jgi:hypothetical protein
LDGFDDHLGDAGMANDYEQPVNTDLFLVAVALPAFGGLYDALLEYRLFG